MENKDRIRERVNIEELDKLYYKPKEEGKVYDKVHYYLAHEGGIRDEEGNKIYKEVSGKTVYTDLEKGYEDMQMIYKRISDGKFFKWNYSYSPHCSVEEMCDPEMIEVFATTKTIQVTTYE
jgi:hypothetical protein